MKFLYFGDRHNSISVPVSRKDDFKETCLKKDLEIIDIGKKNNVSAFLHPGDFWDESSNKVNNELVQEVIHRWFNIDLATIIKNINSNKYSSDSEVYDAIKKQIPLIGVAGNHDLIGNNIKSLPNTTTGLLSSLGIMNLVSKEDPYFFYTEDGLKIAITGSSYHMFMDTPSHIDDYIVKEKLGDYHIHIVHGMLSDKSLGKLIRHTTIDQIKHTKADLTLCGHDHIGFGIVKTDNKYFINIGSVTRIKNDKKEITRKPSVLLIDITKEHGIQLQQIYLKSAEDGEKVLDRSVIEEKKEREAALEEYKREIRTFGIAKSVSIKDIVSDIAKNDKIPDEIKNDVIDRITNKEIEIYSKTKEVKDTQISKVIIENFQSHKHTELEFSDGFNVLIGESSQGKSSILRAIRWVYENKPTGRSFIRKGEKEARVTIFLKNGTMVSRYVTPTKNGYEILHPDGKKEEGNTRLLPEVQKLLGFNDLVIDKDLTVPLNFMKQGEGWFLISGAWSAHQRAKVLGAIKETHFADAVRRELEKEADKTTNAKKESIKKAGMLQEELKKYDYLDDLKSKIDFIEKTYEKIKEYKEKISKITELIEAVKSIKEKIKECDEAIKQLEPLNALKEKINEIKELNNKCATIETLNEEIKLIKPRLNSAVKYISRTDNIEKIRDRFEQLKYLNEALGKIEDATKEYCDLNNKISKCGRIILSMTIDESKKDTLNRIKNLISELDNHEKLFLQAKKIVAEKDSIQKNIKDMEDIIIQTDVTQTLRKRYEDIKGLNDKLDSLNDTSKEYKEIQKNVTKQKDDIEKQTKKVEEYLEEYRAVLSEAGICPVCNGTLEKSIINDIIKNRKEKVLNNE